MKIYGGSCVHPKVDDADVYIGFEKMMTLRPNFFSAEGGKYQILLPIVDQSVPENIDKFNELVDFTIRQLKKGKKVHCGCIGGHGRTGIFFSVLYNKLSGEKDSTTYVRKHYCVKAVESQKQVDWLFDNYGITKVEPRHKPTPLLSSSLDLYGDSGISSSFGWEKQKENEASKAKNYEQHLGKSKTLHFDPNPHGACIWAKK